MILSDVLLQECLDDLNDWGIVNEKLSKKFKFKNFTQAFGFMTQIAITAEAMDHHPEWSNVYNIVEVDLITHSEGGITKLDIDLASKIDSIRSAIK